MAESSTSSTRVKACSECRRHKLRCDARKDYTKACSRCRRLKLECVVLRSFESSKPKSRSDLRAEISRLHGRLRTLQAANPNASAPSANAPLSPIYDEGTIQSPMSAEDYDSSEVQECFDLFMRHYAPQVCVINQTMSSRDYFRLSGLLYWTMVTIGSRKYPANSRLLGTLAPRLTDMIRQAMFNPDLAAIQAFLLLCIWPIPIDTFGKEISTTLSASMLQFAMNKGLHIRGIGQDFSRVTLNPEPALEILRGKLWISCLITAQRLNSAYGLPPPIIIDNFDHEVDDLPPQLLYERRVSQILAAATVELGRVALQSDTGSAGEMRAMISLYTTQMSQLSALERDDMGHYHFLCALLQVQSFSIFVGQDQADPIALIKLYSTACSVVEKIQQLDGQIELTRCASDYTGRMIHLAASIILRMYRSHLKKDIDLMRGQTAYQSAIQLFRKMSIQSDDVMARSTVIITQLWNSTTVFRQPDGTVDSFSMLCRSRLTMSSVFDVWWRWREEFAGQPHPYPDREDSKSQTSRSIVSPSHNNITTDPTLQLPTMTPGPIFEISPSANWDALFDLPPESWDLFGLDNDNPLIYDDPSMPFPSL